MGYHWTDHSQGSTLRFNYRGVGSIQQSGDVYRWSVSLGGRTHEGVTRTPQRAKVWISRWVSARTGIPTEEILRPRED